MSEELYKRIENDFDNHIQELKSLQANIQAEINILINQRERTLRLMRAIDRLQGEKDTQGV